ncbi:hypothetical protein ACBI99_44895 [Nonomuraea sp. ATR24]|uniref:hypothetical protein n=1 Tax=Nonomuraea sp. ATR24 TaxID=1676744 RepID=UPI0035BFD2AC
MIQTTHPLDAEQPDDLASAVQDFDWTRRLDPNVRGLVTTWLEIGERAIRTVSIVPARVPR